MNEDISRKRWISWALIVAHIFLAAHFSVVIAARRGNSAGALPDLGILGTVEVIGTSMIFSCGWTQCLDGDVRPKPLISAIALGGFGCILLGLMLGAAIDRALGPASISTSRAGLVALASLLIGILGVEGFQAVALKQNFKSSRSSRAPMSADQKASDEHYLAGAQFFTNREYEKAATEWKAALKENPGNEDAQRGLRRMEAMTRPTVAAEKCDGSTGPHSPQYLEGVIRFQKQDYLGARERWKEALRETPDDCDVLAGLAKIDKLLAGE